MADRRPAAQPGRTPGSSGRAPSTSSRRSRVEDPDATSTAGSTRPTVRPAAEPREEPTATATPRSAGASTDSGADAVPGRRRVQLTATTLNPWTTLKISFVLSVVAGALLVLATAALWLALDGAGVFETLNELITATSGTPVELRDYIGLGQVISAAIVVAVVDVVLLSALAALGAAVFNVATGLVGGLRVTLSDR